VFAAKVVKSLFRVIEIWLKFLQNIFATHLAAYTLAGMRIALKFYAQRRKILSAQKKIYVRKA
jgi:hypothetical protein